jgi:hypothetical protein
MDGEIDDEKVAQVARGWVAYQRTELPQYAWAVDEKDIWLYQENEWATIERLLRAVCAVATSDESHVIGMIGASLLEDAIHAHPERAMAFLDAEVEHNHVLAEALGSVWCDEPELRARIDEVRGRAN